MSQNITIPHSPDAEEGVIGSILCDPARAIPAVGRLIRSEDFHAPAHRTVYAAALALWHESGSLDLLLLTDALRRAGKLDAVGGAAYVAHLATAMPTAANAEHYAESVRRSSQLRAIWQQCARLSGEALAHDADPAALATSLGQVIASLAAGRPETARTMREHVEAALARYEAAAANRGTRPPGVIPTGIAALDSELAGGLHPGSLAVLAAETSGGKTALAMQVALSAAVGCAGQVMVASYEMPAADLTDRLVALQTGVAAGKLRSGLLSEWDFSRIAGGILPLAESGIHLRDGIGHWTVDDLAAEARALRATTGLDLLVVDYLQLAAPRAVGGQRNREREVAEISRALKGLAVELAVPILALSQLNEDGKLRESRAIGQDSDVVLILTEDPDEGEDSRLVRIEKNRNGARDKAVPLTWNGPLMRFADRAANS